MAAAAAPPSAWPTRVARTLDRWTGATMKESHATGSSSSSSSAGRSASAATPVAPTLRGASLRCLLFVLRLLLHLPWLLFSSDPAMFLPPKDRRSHSHSASHSRSESCGASRKRPAASAAEAAATILTAATAAAAANGSAAAAASSCSSVPAAAAAAPAPPAPAPVPFLSARSFPLPSSLAMQAQYTFSPHEAPSIMEQVASAAASAVSAATGARIRIPGATSAGAGQAGSSSSSAPSSHQIYQHVLRKKKKKKFTLVLDLDETLVHTTDKAIPLYDHRVEIQTKKAHRVFYILKRPFLDLFLLTLSEYFEIVIFTASIRRYADAVIDLIDCQSAVSRRFFRQSCVQSGGSFLKDLRVVSGSDLRRTLLLDNSPVAYSLQEENALPIATWYDDPTDTALRDLIPFLLSLRAMSDVRALLYRRIRFQREAEGHSSCEAWRLRYSMGTIHESAADAPQLSQAAQIVEADEDCEETAAAAEAAKAASSSSSQDVTRRKTGSRKKTPAIVN